MAKVPAFTEIGKSAKELLYGGKDGQFQFNHVLSLTSKTADGVEFSVLAKKSDSGVDPQAKLAYAAPKYSLAATFLANGKVVTSAGLKELAPGLSATVSGTIPDEASGKLAIDYTLPHLTLKTAIGLTSNPKVDFQATTGWQAEDGHLAGVLGGAVVYDTAQGKVTTWSLGSAYQGLDYQVAAVLTDNEIVKATYAHNIDATQAAGAEIVRALSKEVTTFTLGYQKKLEGGALTKFKLDNLGIASVLYETQLQSNTKAAYSMMFDATNLSKPAKFGVALDVKN